MFRDEMIDIALTVLVLGIVISVGLGLAIRTEKKARQDSQILAEDKNTRELRGYGIDEHGDFDGTLTRPEVLLMMQVQDYYMPEPKKVTIVDINGIETEIEIVSTYKEELMNYGIQAYNKLKDFSADTKYDVRFSRGLLADDPTDDTYLIRKSTD